MNTIALNTEQVKFVDMDEPRKASEAANEEAANTGSIPLPGVLFRQGTRYCISTAIPMRQIRTRIAVDSARKGGNVKDVLGATNRPTDGGHVKNIADYLRSNVGRQYILPPMTLNVQQPITIYRPHARDFGAVYIVVPETARLSVTDGGHRTKAILEAYDRMDEEQQADFNRDAVSVMITLEGDLTKVHQDFADCSKTKPLPKSQLAAYDRRNPANGLVLDIIENCSIFVDKIDSTSSTLSINSTQLFLTNQVRQLVKELLVGDYGLADADFEARAHSLLRSSSTDHYKGELSKFVEFINLVTEAVPVLREIAHLPPGTPRNIIQERRKEGWICLTATGLNIIGRIGNELFKTQRVDWREMAKRLGTVDWSREAALWQGNIVRDGKITTQRAPVRTAVEHVRETIGLPARMTASSQEKQAI
jgi:DGQHR domain-containing protein